MTSDVPPPDDLDAAPGLSRRTVLRGALTLGVVGVAGGLVLSACGGDDGDDEGIGRRVRQRVAER